MVRAGCGQGCAVSLLNTGSACDQKPADIFLPHRPNLVSLLKTFAAQDIRSRTIPCRLLKPGGCCNTHLGPVPEAAEARGSEELIQVRLVVWALAGRKLGRAAARLVAFA